MATSTGKKARKRYGNRFAAKQRRDSGSKRGRKRRTFGKLPFSVSAGNAPMGAVAANEAHVFRMAEARRARGFDQDANVAVGDGFTKRYEQVEAERAATREAARKLRAKTRKDDVEEEEDYDGR